MPDKMITILWGSPPDRIFVATMLPDVTDDEILSLFQSIRNRRGEIKSINMVDENWKDLEEGFVLQNIIGEELSNDDFNSFFPKYEHFRAYYNRLPTKEKKDVFLQNAIDTERYEWVAAIKKEENG